MNKVKFYALFLLMLVSKMAGAQKVVVNQYFNAADQRDEWIELVVVTDNTDMRNWTIRDDNSSQTAWQTAVTFNNVAFWNNMRAGTVIILWNRMVESDGTTAHTTDVNKNDGYIEINVQNATYFNGGSFGTSPTWGGNSLNIAGGGDVIELRDGSGTHIHALGHCSTAGSDWTALPAPKLNHQNSANSGDAIYACPGRSVGNFNGPATGNNFTSKNNSTLTFGLPNTCGASATGNKTFIDSLREPIMTAQTVTPTVSIPGNITFAWTAATDPNAADNTIGYMILRNTSNTFSTPVDGTTYTVGSSLGAATVLFEINSSSTITYTDATVVAGLSYYYKVYAFRYTTDNLNGNSYDNSRGRAYNQTNFVFVNSVAPLPIQLLGFSADRAGDKVQLKWSTATETNNDYFTVERSADAVEFMPIIKVAGAGNSSEILHYSAVDDAPLDGTSYYRLKQTDYNGSKTYSSVITLKESTGILVQNIYPNPVNDLLTAELNTPQESRITVNVMNIFGRCVLKKEFFLKEGNNELKINLENIPTGTYFLLMEQSGNDVYHCKFIKE